MRYVNGVVCGALSLFALVQYNDPDALLWFLIYAVPAAWAGAVAFRPHLLPARRPTRALFLACLAAAVLGSIDLRPTLAAGWLDVEEEREGLGLIIATVGLMVAGWTWWQQERRAPADPAAAR